MWLDCKALEGIHLLRMERMKRGELDKVMETQKEREHL